MKQKRAAEARLKAAATSADTKIQGAADAWKTITEVQEKRRQMQGKEGSLRSQLYGIAETLVLMSMEDPKDSKERLREFRDSNRSSLEQSLFSPAPIYEDLERVQLADELGRMAEDRGGDAPLVLELLAGKNPRDRAAEVIAATKLMDVEVRKALAKGGAAAIRLVAIR